MRHSLETLLVVAIMFGLSLVAAWVLYDVLESVAEGTYLGFKIGGAAAVFVVIFLLLRRTYTDLLGKDIVRVRIDFPSGNVPESVDENAECSYIIYNTKSLNESKSKRAILLREAASLVFYVRSRNPDELIKIELQAGSNTWRSHYEGLHVSPIEVRQA